MHEQNGEATCYNVKLCPQYFSFTQSSMRSPLHLPFTRIHPTTSLSLQWSQQSVNNNELDGNLLLVQSEKCLPKSTSGQQMLSLYTHYIQQSWLKRCFTSNRNRRFIRDGSLGHPPRLTHNSWALIQQSRQKWVKTGDAILYWPGVLGVIWTLEDASLAVSSKSKALGSGALGKDKHKRCFTGIRIFVVINIYIYLKNM